jgi:hypothetical protein
VGWDFSVSLYGVVTFYIIIFIATFFFYIEKHYTSKNRIFEKIAIIFLIIVAGLRYNTGRDYLNYYQIYDWIKEGGERFEVGFYYLFKILGGLDLSYQFSLFLISVFVTLTVYYTLIKPIPIRYRYVSLFFFLIIYENYFNIVANSLVRQSISVAIFIIAVQYIIKKNFISYFLMILLGAMFHLSAILMLPFYFVRKIKIKILYGFIFLLGVFFIFPAILPNTLKVILESIGLGEMANLNYLSVIHREISAKEVMKNIFYIFIFIQFIVVAKLSNKALDKKEIIYIKLLLIGLVFKLYISAGLDMFHRLLPYFYIFYIPVVYILLRESKKIKNGYIMSIFFLFFFIFHIKQTLSPPEYSKYYGQFQFIVFKTKQEIANDISIWKNENNEITKEKIKRITGK